MSKKLLTVLVGLLTTSTIFVSSAQSFNAKTTVPNLEVIQTKELQINQENKLENPSAVGNQQIVDFELNVASDRFSELVIVDLCGIAERTLAEAQNEHARLADVFVAAQTAYDSARENGANEEVLDELFEDYIVATDDLRNSGAYVRHLQRELDKVCE